MKEKTLHEDTRFWTDGVATSKFECTVNLTRFRQQLVERRIIQIDYCKLYVPVTVHREQSVKKEHQQDATI